MSGEVGQAEVWAQEATGGLDGFNQSLTEALAPYQAEETEWTLDDMIKRCQQRISKVSSKFYKDDRMHTKATNTQAKGLIEEFVEAVMQTLQQGCQGKDWFPNVDFTKVLMFATMYTFGKAKCFTRVLAPMIEKFIEEGVYKWQEEERIQKCMWDAVELSGVQDAFKKKTLQHLTKSYDEAYLKSPYGSCTGETPEVSLLMDFLTGWITDFVGRAWDVLERGVGAGSKDEQILFVASLYQSLCDPTVMCVPFEIHQSMESLPANPWDFIGKTVEQVFLTAETSAAGRAATQAVKATDEPWSKKRKVEGFGPLTPGSVGPKLITTGQSWMPGIM
jgi:hypothetical protein